LPASDLTNKNPDGAVTKYATTNHKERFAESYLYYIQNPSELKKRDPEVYNFMYEHIFQGKEFQEALIKQENQLALGSVWEIPGYMDKIKQIPVIVGSIIIVFCLTSGAFDLILNGPIPFVNHVLSMF